VGTFRSHLYQLRHMYLRQPFALNDGREVLFPNISLILLFISLEQSVS